MTRLQRWERAQKWGLSPPREVSPDVPPIASAHRPDLPDPQNSRRNQGGSLPGIRPVGLRLIFPALNHCSYTHVVLYASMYNSLQGYPSARSHEPREYEAANRAQDQQRDVDQVVVFPVRLDKQIKGREQETRQT